MTHRDLLDRLTDIRKTVSRIEYANAAEMDKPLIDAERYAEALQLLDVLLLDLATKGIRP